MYSPHPFDETRIDVLHELVRSHPLGTFVLFADGELCANHMPFLIDPRAGALGTLRAHVSRANPVWRQLGGAAAALVVFQGPDSYITPSWYPSKHADGKAVPTWNYAVVHAHGEPRAIEDRAWLREHVTQLTAAHEAPQAQPWQLSDAPGDYLEHMLGRIVGLEMPIAKLEGKWKVSQNRSRADRLGVATGLESQATDRSRAMAELVMQRAGSP